jgi:oxygen-dependent protoporphyrinogen oxidase
VRRVIVVGGGPSGLVLGRELVTRGAGAVDVTVYEAQVHPGGKAWTEHEAGYVIERGPEGFLDSAPATLALVRDVGLAERLLPASAGASKRYLYARGALRTVPTNPVAFFGSGILSFGGRLAVLGEPFRPRNRSGDETVASFARRRLGAEAAASLVGAMVRGVYAGDAESLSMSAAFPRLAALERQHGSLVKALVALRWSKLGEGGGGQAAGGPAGPSGRLMSFESGMAELGEALATALAGRFVLGRPAVAVSRTGGGGGGGARWRVEFADGRSEYCDAVALATEPWRASRLVAAASSGLGSALAEIPAAPVVVVALGFATQDIRHRLDGFGFLVPPTEPLRMLGCLWSSATFARRAPQGRVLLRVMLGGSHDAAVLDLPDDRLVRLVLAELDRTLGLRGSPDMIRIIRWPTGIPQYTLGHGERLARIARELERLPGLYLAGNGYRGIALNDCVVASQAVARAILSACADRGAAEGVEPS